MYGTGELLRTTSWSRSYLQKLLKDGYILNKEKDLDRIEEGRNRQFSWHTVVCANTIAWGLRLDLPLEAAKEGAWDFAYVGGTRARWVGEDGQPEFDENFPDRDPAGLFKDGDTFLIWRPSTEGGFNSQVLNVKKGEALSSVFSRTLCTGTDHRSGGLIALDLHMPMLLLADALGLPRSVIYGGKID